MRKKLINDEGFKIPEIKFVNETDMNLVKKKYSDEKWNFDIFLIIISNQPISKLPFSLSQSIICKRL